MNEMKGLRGNIKGESVFFYYIIELSFWNRGCDRMCCELIKRGNIWLYYDMFVFVS